VGGEFQYRKGEAVRTLGKRKAMERMSVDGGGGICLDLHAWEHGFKQRAMRACIQARASVDPSFVKACKALVARGLRIRHFARMVFYRSKATGLLVGVDIVGPLLEEVGGLVLLHE